MFLANENFPRPGILLLRGSGYKIKSIQETTPGVSDYKVLELAKAENLTILTFDKDYGELIFRYNFIKPPAVIYFRDKGNNPLFAAQLLLSLLSNSQIKFENSFTVVEEQNIRQRFYDGKT